MVLRLSRLHLLAGVAPSRTEIGAMGLEFRFGRFETFIWLFEEVFVGAPYAVFLDRDQPVILDCGANIGLSVLYLKRRFPGAKITAFEPDPRNVALLAENLALNQIADVVCESVALGRDDGVADFFSEPIAGSALGTLGAPADARPGLVATYEVPVKRLSSFVDGQVDLIKLDIEGGEFDVLSELEASGKLGQVSRLLIEFHHHLRAGQPSLADALTLLERAGFDYQVGTPGLTRLVEGEATDVLIYAYRREAHVSI